MRSLRYLPLASLALLVGACLPPQGTPPPRVVQESEPNDAELQADVLPLAPDTFRGTVVVPPDALADDYWTFTAPVDGVLTIERVSCTGISNVSVYTADDAGDLAQCAGGITNDPTITLTAGEQAFVTILGVTGDVTYAYLATFTPSP